MILQSVIFRKAVTDLTEGRELKENRNEGHEELRRLCGHPREPEEETVPIGGPRDAAE